MPGCDHIREQDLLLGLSENYGAIYYVDFDKDRIKPFRMNEVIEKAFGAYFRTLPTYESAINSYISTVVSEKDREEMYAVTRYEFLREQLRDARAYSHEYRLERNGREYVFRFKIANLDGIGELHHAVIGFADVSMEKTSVFDYRIGRKVLIVDADETNRKCMEEILSVKYRVLTATTGTEALQVLASSFEDIGLVMTDLRLPELDGYELIRQMKRVRQYSLIPIIVLVDQPAMEEIEDAEVSYLQMGASDMILRPYNSIVVLNRVKSMMSLRESMYLLNTLERDPLTGLYSKEFFYHQVEQRMQDCPDEGYAMIVSDIEGLKIINEKYGIEMGDEILRTLATHGGVIDGILFGGRIEGDKFAALVLESSLSNLLKLMEKPDMGIRFPLENVVIKNGIYHIRHRSTLEPQGMYDRALLALQKIKNTYGVYVSEYDDVLRKDLLTKRLVAETAEAALQEHQFEVYYQPKFDLHDGRTNGAEALIRWIHPELGFMNPGVFIPLFEQNGFIRKLDYYVWEEVCRAMRDWKNRGVRVVPISVNVSRRDFDDEQLADRIASLVEHYGLESSLFHIEVTESSYSDNPQRIAETIRAFHEKGFVVELDDFGSGYSSMAALTELELDIMKLDMSLIQKDKPDSDRSALKFSMQLARLMNLKTVAEGVETEAQRDRISDLGGDYIQGYYYSKPLPKDAFEDYLRQESAGKSNVQQREDGSGE